jgi:hypothetical protein
MTDCTCTECGRKDLPAVPGCVVLASAHADPCGNPCEDGLNEVPRVPTTSPAWETCTRHGVTKAATAEGLTVPAWQARNLAELDL